MAHVLQGNAAGGSRRSLSPAYASNLFCRVLQVQVYDFQGGAVQQLFF